MAWVFQRTLDSKKEVSRDSQGCLKIPEHHAQVLASLQSQWKRIALENGEPVYFEVYDVDTDKTYGMQLRRMLFKDTFRLGEYEWGSAFANGRELKLGDKIELRFTKAHRSTHGRLEFRVLERKFI
ncbi:hypothetical protein Ancab_015255 [Ancistrocladus abbreviatus]